MGKYKSFVVLGAAVLVALIATVLIMSWLRAKTGTRQPVVLETQDVVISKVDLKWGTVLSKELLETKPFLKKSLPPGCVSDSKSIIGRVLLSSVSASEPILESRLAPVSMKTGGVAAVVRQKRRAIAVKVDKVIGVSGFIHPGNRVDVLVTITSGKNSSNPVTKTVLENILVLATGPEIESKGKEEKPSTVDVITLEVSPEEAEKLSLAASEGKVQLALRNFNDTEDVITRGTTIPALLASYSYVPVKTVPARAASSKKPAPVKVAMPAEGRKIQEEKPAIVERLREPAITEKAQKPMIVVEVIKGSQTTQVKFEKGE